MCGICGVWNLKQQPVDVKSIISMRDIMAHRGPDGSGTAIFSSKNLADPISFQEQNELISVGNGYDITIGHRRLAIIDLSLAGAQPMCDDSEEIWITYNGEIYNYQEIRRELEGKKYRFRSNTDTEVIIYAYKEWGYDCVHKFNGMFAFGIWDNRFKLLFLARDRLGIKPLYYVVTPEYFIFASEIKSILASKAIEKEVDYEALNTTLFFQVTPQTGFKSIKKFPSAHYAIIKNGCPEFFRYWEIKVPEDPMENMKNAVGELYNLIDDTVGKQIIADVPVGAFLSGGLDSSCVVAFMQRHLVNTVHTFTIKFREEDKRFESMPEDEIYARQVANYLHTSHKEFEIQPEILDLLPEMIYHIEEPLADPAAINTFLISKYARQQGIIVLLNGMGSDEIFGGYRLDRACLLADLYQRFLPFVFRKYANFIIDRLPVASQSSGFRYLRWIKLFSRFANLDPADRFFSGYSIVPINEIPRLFTHDFLKSSNHSWSMEKFYSFFSENHLTYLQQMTLCDTNIYLQEHNLTYSDKATMAASIEGRPPLVDHRIVEFAFQIGDHLKIRGNRQKVILREVIRDLLPKEIINRPKAPFSAPLRSWIRNDLKQLIDDLLSYKAIKNRGIYNHDFVQRKIEMDRRGKEDNAFFIWVLLNLELWFRAFFD